MRMVPHKVETLQNTIFSDMCLRGGRFPKAQRRDSKRHTKLLQSAQQLVHVSLKISFDTCFSSSRCFPK